VCLLLAHFRALQNVCFYIVDAQRVATMEQPNVLLVVLDSIRAQNTSLHGYDRETTPFLEEFADRSTVYTQARAPSIHSVASHVSMFTGAHVEQHRAFRHTAQIDTSQSIWAELHDEFGYSTGLFTSNRIVADASNLADCFADQYTADFPIQHDFLNVLERPRIEQMYYRLEEMLLDLANRFDAGESDSDSGESGILQRAADTAELLEERLTSADSDFKTIHGSRFTDAFLDWQSRQDGPWAACVNLMDPHSPWKPDTEFDRWADDEHWQTQENLPSVRENLEGSGWDKLAALEPLYDGSILQSDAIMREFVRDLDRQGLLDETLLIITSDHGETFGEQSRLDPEIRFRDHKWGIPEVLTHVPLLVRQPGQESGKTVEQAVSLTDLPATIRAAVTGQDEEPLRSDGPVLASTFRMPEKKVPRYSSVDGIESYKGPWRAVYETRGETVRKYAQKGEQYLTLDIHSPHDIEVVSRDSHSRVAEEFDPLSDSTILSEKTSEIDEDLESQLEDLGYIR